MKDHKTAYVEWLESVNDALIADGKRGLFGFRKKPLPHGPDGEIPDEPDDPSVAEVLQACEKAGVKPFVWYRS